MRKAVVAIALLLAVNARGVCEDKRIERVYGKIQVVTHFPDFKVRVVDSFPDIKIRVVTAFPDKPGRWQFVDSFPDYTVKFVNSGEDFTIQYIGNSKEGSRRKRD